MKNLKTYRANLVNYTPEAIQETLPTSSTANEVSAMTDLLQAAQIIADSWPRLSTKTIQNFCTHCGFKHSDLEMPNKVDSESGVIQEMHHV
jgi:hypothetical protein